MNKAAIVEAMKSAMRAKNQAQLKTIRLILAEIKRIEVDQRIDVDETAVLNILEKMIKQRKDSIEQFAAAKRDDLIQIEQDELAIIQSFMPTPLSEDLIDAEILKAIHEVGAQSMKDMGAVMNLLRPRLLGKADIGQVSAWVKAKLI